MKKYLKFIIPLVLLIILLIPIKVQRGYIGGFCYGSICSYDPYNIKAPIGVFLIEAIFDVELKSLYIDEGFI